MYCDIIISMKIGVFDSGVGGLSVVNAIKQAYPRVDVIYRDDKQHVPYGNRSISEIHSYVQPILIELAHKGCEVIVIACNTVTTNLFDELAKEVPSRLIGMEPMVEDAVNLTKNKTIAICATPRTLSSRRYQSLIKDFAGGIKVVEPDCSDWAYMVENNKIDLIKIQNRTMEVLEQGADVIVLGCTHYHWIEQLITEVSKGQAIVLQPEPKLIKKLSSIIGESAN